MNSPHFKNELKAEGLKGLEAGGCVILGGMCMQAWEWGISYYQDGYCRTF